MTTPTTENQAQVAESPKNNDKECNFAQMRRQLEQERQARQLAEEKAARLEAERSKPQDDDVPSDEPYVDHRNLEKKLNKFEQRMEAKIDQKAEQKARMMVEQERQQQWLKNNSDFYDVMQHAQKFADKDPELAETILSMPEGFERQKLVYKNIKALGLHKKEEPKPSIQETIDQKRRSPYYQPSGVGAAPYAASGDYSPAGQKNAYAQMQELKKRLRI